jgi:Fe-S cluster assembly ATP-binding protein
MKELVIDDLHVSVENKEILKGVTLKVNSGDTLALLGPNGHGKSTLLNAIMGHPRYKVTSGSIVLDGEDVLKMTVDERARKGLFMAFQTPPEVPGVETMDFLKEALNAKRDSDNPIGLFDLYKILKNGYAKAGLSQDMNTRHLNEGFSGGEKKRNEILQMLLLNPSLCMMDEIDSGLDVDALKLVSEAIKEQQALGSSFIIISHYARLFELVSPNRAAIMINGRIALEGGADLVSRVDKEGYEWLRSQYGIEIKKEEDKPIVLESCAVKKKK